MSLAITDITEKNILGFDKDKSKKWYNDKKIRKVQQEDAKKRAYAQKTALKNKDSKVDDIKAKQAYIMAALQRTISKKDEK